MALITIQFGSRASSSTLNNNFRYLAELIQSQIQSLTAIVNNSKSSLEAIVASFEASVYKIGEPKISLTNSLQDNEIWLEGAEVLQTDYPNLYALWGNTYGTASQAGYFKLPDFRNRALWGGTNFGYLAAALPNITGDIYTSTVNSLGSASGVFTRSAYSGGTNESWGVLVIILILMLQGQVPYIKTVLLLFNPLQSLLELKRGTNENLFLR